MSKSDSNGSGEGMVGSIAGFGNSIASLAELQAKLAALDFQETKARGVVPLGVALASLVVFLGAVPVALGGVALVVASAFALSTGVALLLTGVVTLLASGAVAAFATLRFSRSFESFRRSREELTRNLSWIRTVLVHSGRAAPRRQF